MLLYVWSTLGYGFRNAPLFFLGEMGFTKKIRECGGLAVAHSAKQKGGAHGAPGKKGFLLLKGFPLVRTGPEGTAVRRTPIMDSQNFQGVKFSSLK